MWQNLLSRSILFFSIFFCVNAQSAFILGLEGGREFRNGQVQISRVNADPAVTAATGIPVGTTMANVVEKFHDSGTVFGILAGVEAQYGWFVSSLELHIAWETLAEEQHFGYADQMGTNTFFASSFTYDRGTRIELSNRTGILGINRVFVPYIVLGGFYTTDEATLGTTLTNGGFSAFDSYSKTHDIWGWLAGVGIEYPLFNDSIVPLLRYSAVRLEYKYMRGERFTMNDNIVPLYGTITLRPSAHLLQLALVFKRT